MKFVRVGLFVALGAFAALCWLAPRASAEILNPNSPYTPYQPESKADHFMPAAPKSVASGSTQAPDTAPEPATTTDSPAPTQPEAVAPASRPAPTIAPESVVTRTTRAPVQTSLLSEKQTVADTAVQTTEEAGPFQEVRAFLARVAKACQVGVVSVAGGPALMLAVLAVLAFVAMNLTQSGQTIRNEAANELLYSAVVIAPG